MDESDRLCMQCLSLELEWAFFWSVDRISQDRMTDGGHVNPDLVCPPGFQLEFTAGIGTETFEHMIMRHSPPSGRVNGHFLPISLRTGYRSINCSVVIFDISDDNPFIDAIDRMFFDLGSDGIMRFVIFADDEGSRRIPVYSMDDSRSFFSVDSGQGIPAMIHDGIYQGIVFMSRRWMNDHPLGLIYDQNVVVLVENIQRNILGDGFHLFWLRKSNRKLIPLRNLVRVLANISILLPVSYIIIFEVSLAQ